MRRQVRRHENDTMSLCASHVIVLQLPQASKQPPPRRGKVRRGRAAGDASDGDEASDDAGDDAADAEAAEGMEGSQAGRGAEDEKGLQEDEERAEDGDGDGEVAAAVRRQRALRQSQGAGFVAFMPAQLSAVSGCGGGRWWPCWVGLIMGAIVTGLCSRLKLVLVVA